MRVDSGIVAQRVGGRCSRHRFRGQKVYHPVIAGAAELFFIRMQQLCPVHERMIEIAVDCRVDQLHQEGGLGLVTVAQSKHAKAVIGQEEFDGTVSFPFSAVIENPR